MQVSGVLEHAAEMELFEGDVSQISVSELMEAREQKGCTPLHCAAKHGHAEAGRQGSGVIRRSVRVHKAYACLKVCALLLKRRADVRAVEGGRGRGSPVAERSRGSSESSLDSVRPRCGAPGPGGLAWAPERGAEPPAAPGASARQRSEGAAAWHRGHGPVAQARPEAFGVQPRNAFHLAARLDVLRLASFLAHSDS